jgi:serine/threonine protein phosphatase PrpC
MTFAERVHYSIGALSVEGATILLQLSISITTPHSVRCRRREVSKRSGGIVRQLTTTQRVEVTEGDIVILGTDGVFDNLFDEEIVQSVQTTLTIQEQQNSEDLAQKIAENIPSEASKVLFNNIFEVFGFDTSHI